MAFVGIALLALSTMCSAQLIQPVPGATGQNYDSSGRPLDNNGKVIDRLAITDVTLDGVEIHAPWWYVGPDTLEYRNGSKVCALINKSPQGIWYLSIIYIPSLFDYAKLSDAMQVATYACATGNVTPPAKPTPIPVKPSPTE